MTSFPTETITRTFGLQPIDSEPDYDNSVFQKFNSAVNELIRVGIKLEDHLFETGNLISVKKFYGIVVQKDSVKHFLRSLKIRERLLRCASEYAYFAIRNSKQIKDLFTVMVDLLAEKSDWIDRSSKFLRYWDFEKKDNKNKNSLKIEIVQQIKDSYLTLFPKRKAWLNSYIIQNYFSHLQKHLVAELISRISETQLDLNINEEILINHYDRTYIDKLLSRFCTNVSTILTRQFKLKRNKEKSTKRQKEKESPLSKVIFQICKTKQLNSVDIGSWQLKKQQWMLKYRQSLEKLMNPKFITEQINASKKRIQNTPIIPITTSLFKQNLCRFNHKVKGVPQEDFIHFFGQIVDNHQIHLLANQNKKIILPEVRQILLLISENPMNYLKVPQCNKAAIPLGIDDGQVYSIEVMDQEVGVNLSFYPNQKHRYKLVSSKRFFEMIEKGAVPSRGVLKASGGKLQLAIPFSKRLPPMQKRKPVEEQKILNCDLGLKTLATLSVTINGSEIDRVFLDQNELSGPKNWWFLPYRERKKAIRSQYLTQINYKLKLMKLRKRINVLRSELSQIKRENIEKRLKNPKYPKYSKTKKYWFKRQEYKQCWNKIQNIHKELIHQLSSRIVEYAKYKQVDSIRFEDLRWSKNASKRDVGYFLATWQVHWFFSRIIEHSAQIARRNGISVTIVNPYKSSKTCSWCGTEGKRKGKMFVCIHPECGLHLDSDLNAARNLGNPSRKWIPVRL